VLLDIGLPGLDGFEVARSLRQQADADGTLLVAVTGYGQEADRRRALAAGFDYHLVKPIRLDELSQILALAPPPRRMR
jgi:CheY-like chemotaxis protein